MKTYKGLVAALLLIVLSVGWFSCKKTANDSSREPYKFSYGDSIIFLKPQSSDYIVFPTETRPGLYEGFPDGIQIDEVTGAINVSKSETGLRYRITHTAPDGTKTVTMVVLSGITFTDKYYHLSQNDSIAFPVYNALSSRQLPVTGSVFDDGGGAHASGCDVQTINGQINLTQSIRDGLFGNSPTDDQRRDIDIVYRLNDGSQKAVNRLRVRIYYYTSMANVAPDLLQTIQDRQTDGVFLKGGTADVTGQTARLNGLAKPRPPCVVIIAN